MGSASSHVQHLFYAGANDPRIFNTAVVTPRRIVRSQRHRQSGNRYPTAVTNQSEWAECQVEGGLDRADLVLLLASLFPYRRESNGDFRFLSLAGAGAPGYDAPKMWDKLQSYNWRGAVSGPSYEAAGPVLQSLEMAFDRRERTTLTAAFAAKEYAEIAQPATRPAPAAVDTQLVRNSDIRIGLSAGRLGNFAYPTSVLAARWTFTDLVELVFGANQSDRGYTDFVEAAIEPLLTVRFMASADYLTYANVDADTFVSLSDASGTFEWVHRARFVDVPGGPGARGNLQEVEIAFLPYARVEGRAVDLQLAFTAAQGTGSQAALFGYTTAGAAIGAGLAATAGYLPPGLDTILYDSGSDRITVGTADAAARDWPANWEPASVQIGAGAVHALTYDPGTRVWRTQGGITANPLPAGAATATIAWRWTPATYMSGFVNGTGVPNL